MSAPLIRDPEERERWRRNPAAYNVTELLHDANDELAAALAEVINETAIRLHRDSIMPSRPPERLTEARERLKRAQSEWRAVLVAADALLRSQEGG